MKLKCPLVQMKESLLVAGLVELCAAGRGL